MTDAEARVAAVRVLDRIQDAAAYRRLGMSAAAKDAGIEASRIRREIDARRSEHDMACMCVGCMEGGR